MKELSIPLASHQGPVADNRVSVDCVVLGFDGVRLNVLLIRRTGEDEGEEFNDMKLPGSLIYVGESLDDAARRVLHELTGLSDVSMKQFKAFGSKERTSNPRDVHWLERMTDMKIDSIVTISYIALIKIDSSINKSIDNTQALWVPVDEVGNLAFDHNEILTQAVDRVQALTTLHPDFIIDLLPKKFTILQLRKLFEVLFQRKIDAGNFYKKLSMMPYITALDEKEEGKPHKPARLYTFDRKQYKKMYPKRY